MKQDFRGWLTVGNKRTELYLSDDGHGGPVWLVREVPHASPLAAATTPARRIAAESADALEKTMEFCRAHGRTITEPNDPARSKALAQAATQALAMLERHDPGTADAIRAEFKAALAPIHTPNGYDPDWLAPINAALKDREANTELEDMTDELWESFIGPMLDAIEKQGA